MAEGVTQVAMEAAGVYWRPVWHVLEEETSLELLLVNAHDVKAVPGRKTDVADACWLAQLRHAAGSLRPRSKRRNPTPENRHLGRNLLSSMALGHQVSVAKVDTRPDFADLYREIGPQLWRAILAYSGGRRDVADDAVGEAFARAMESRTRIRSPFPWLYRTAFRIAAAELRRDVRDAPEDGSYVDDPATGDLMRAMRRLSPKARAAIYLHYQADLSVREIASLTGSSVAAVKVQLHRGRTHLRELLGAEETGHD